MKRPGFLKDAIAKSDGYYSPKGEKLKSQKMSQEEQDAWNGVKKAAPKKAEEVEEAPVEEKKESLVTKVAKKVRRKK